MAHETKVDGIARAGAPRHESIGPGGSFVDIPKGGYTAPAAAPAKPPSSMMPAVTPKPTGTPPPGGGAATSGTVGQAGSAQPSGRALAAE